MPGNELEQPQPLSSHHNAIDAVYFNGSSSESNILVTGIARRKNNIVNGFMYLMVPEFSGKLLMTEALPETTLHQTEDEIDQYAATGIRLTPQEPMKKWSIAYSGIMKEESTDRKVNVVLKAQFNSKLKCFNYDRDMHPNSSAHAISREKWSKEYFDLVKTLHQTHYEQYGEIEGCAEIDGKKYTINMPAVRDHSFGLQRNWKLFHRYIMHFLSLENGDRLTVGVICIPATMSRITVGFITKAGKNIPIESCDLQLYQHGEMGTPPRDYAFQFRAGGEDYVVQVDGYLAPEFFLGLDNECRIVEMFSRFKVNGVKGWGAAEWQYRNM